MKKTHNQGLIEFYSLAVHKLTSTLWSQSLAAKGVVYLITTVHIQIPHACCHNSWAYDLRIVHIYTYCIVVVRMYAPQLAQS